MALPYRIAIATSDPVDRNRLRDFLRHAGHEIVLEASNAEDLIQKCCKVSPHLILVDIEKCGIDCVESIRVLLEQHDIPSIVVAGEESQAYVVQANSCGALAYLTNPVRQNELAGAVRIAMRRFQDFQLLCGEVADSRHALEDRKVVERAKGIVMKQRRLEEDAAFHFLQQLARSHRQKLINVAKSIVLADQALSTRG